MNEDYKQTARWLEADWGPLHVHEKMRALIRQRDDARAELENRIKAEIDAEQAPIKEALFSIAEAEARGFERGVRAAAKVVEVTADKFSSERTIRTILALLEPVTPQKPEA